MTHAFTVAQAKGVKTCPTRHRPREGTRIGRLYDMLMAHKGQWVEFALADYAIANMSTALEYLRSGYNLDIRCRRGHGYCRWLLAGEWDGRAYIDYVIDNGEGGAA